MTSSRSEAGMTSSETDSADKQISLNILDENEVDVEVESNENQRLAPSSGDEPNGNAQNKSNNDTLHNVIDSKPESPSFRMFGYRLPSLHAPHIELHSREVLFAISTFFLLSVSIGLMVVMMSMGAKHDPNDRPPCVTKECLQAAADILENMNQRANPCEDFWEYACGGWIEKTTIPASSVSWSVSDEVKQKIDGMLKQLLSEPVERDLPDSSERKVKLFFERCMDTEEYEDLEDTTLRNMISDLGGFAAIENWNEATYDFEASLGKLHFKYFLEAFFSKWVAPDAKNSNRERLHISSLELTLINQKFYSDETIVNAYKNYMKKIAEIYGISGINSNSFANDVFAFEKKLADFTPPPERMMTSPYEPISLKDLQQLAPGINWQGLFGQHFTTMNADTTVIILGSKDYFKQISNLITGTNNRILNKYLIWRLFLYFAKDLSWPYRSAANDFQEALDGTRQGYERDKYCIDQVNHWMGKALGAMYVKSHFSKERKEEVISMMKHIRNEFRNTLKSSQWMEKTSRQNTIEKLDAIVFKIGYPEFLERPEAVDAVYKDISFEEEQSFLDYQIRLNENEINIMKSKLSAWDEGDEGFPPHEVNAAYDRSTNEIFHPAGILQSPYFRANSPAYLNYGGIGSSIGHEIIHAFDPTGMQFNALGLMESILSNATVNAFRNRTACFKEYYGNQTLDSHKIDGELTAGENIADVVGLKHTYQAYQKHFGKSKKLLGLPGLKLTPDQMFFVSFGQNWCSKQTPESMMFMAGNVHAPPQIRVRGTVAQTPSFAEAFQCGAGSAMVAEVQCELW